METMLNEVEGWGGDCCKGFEQFRTISYNLEQFRTIQNNFTEQFGQIRRRIWTNLNEFSEIRTKSNKLGQIRMRLRKNSKTNSDKSKKNSDKIRRNFRLNSKEIMVPPFEERKSQNPLPKRDNQSKCTKHNKIHKTPTNLLIPFSLLNFTGFHLSGIVWTYPPRDNGASSSNYGSSYGEC